MTLAKSRWRRIKLLKNFRWPHSICFFIKPAAPFPNYSKICHDPEIQLWNNGKNCDQWLLVQNAEKSVAPLLMFTKIVSGPVC